jgi:hypothetical protein
MSDREENLERPPLRGEEPFTILDGAGQCKKKGRHKGRPFTDSTLPAGQLSSLSVNFDRERTHNFELFRID